MIINVNKPPGYTSRDVVNILSKHFNTKKVGHTGTLDPLAAGVLIVCTNEDTKLVELLSAKTKEYTVQMQLGIKTDTGDIMGSVIEEKNVNIKEERLRECINNFIGEYTQEVPAFSAVKVKGKKLYEYARNKESVTLPKRQVVIYSSEFIKNEGKIVEFKVKVSKGTYIRSLINDICTKLNTIGTMSNLTRTAQGEFSLSTSNELEDIKNNNFTTISKEKLLREYPFEKITAANKKQILNGALINKTFNSKYIIYTDKDDEVVAIYQEYVKDKNLAKPYIMFKIN